MADGYASGRCTRTRLEDTGHNEYPAVTSRFLSTKVIDFNGQKFGYDKKPLMTSSFVCIFLLIVSGGQWMYFRRVWKTAILRGFE